MFWRDNDAFVRGQRYDFEMICDLCLGHVPCTMQQANGHARAGSMAMAAASTQAAT
jgi:hypothetical protein